MANLRDLIRNKTKLIAPIEKSIALAFPIEQCHQQFSLEEQLIANWIPEPKLETKLEAKAETFSLAIELNEKQELAAQYAFEGRSFVLTGAAGTGKTTAAREIAKRLLQSDKLVSHDFKSGWGPSIAFCAFTHVATGNIRKALHKDPELEEKLQHNILTIHKLLEFEPEFFEVKQEDGTYKTSMRFIPRRNASRPLKLTHLVIEEASMVDAQGLWSKLFDALLPGTQLIFIGDINQLPPIFGASVLNYALINLPVVELTEVYRQALDSNIIVNAHRVLKGQSIQADGKEVKLLQSPVGSKLLSEHQLSIAIKNTLHKEWLNGKAYDPDLDIVLSPFNKNDLGTINLNRHIAQFFGDHDNRPVWEIFAGMSRHYLAVGDKVFVNKQDGKIKSIHHNAKYFGRTPRPASENMTRHGVLIPKGGTGAGEAFEDSEFELDYSNINVEDISDKEKKNEASHIVTVILEDGEELVLNTVGDFSPNSFSLGYCLTVHKSQGREWRRVFIILHRNHAVLLFRELLYTALTRASKEVVIVDKTNTIDRAIKTQRIKGNTTLEKIEWFNSKIALDVPVPLVP